MQSGAAARFTAFTISGSESDRWREVFSALVARDTAPGKIAAHNNAASATDVRATVRAVRSLAGLMPSATSVAAAGTKKGMIAAQ